MEPSSIDELLVGAIDLHYHASPSPFPRELTTAEAAEHYDAAGFRAAVTKSHHHATVMEILALQPDVLDRLGVTLYGSITLNRHVGGLNPAAVELAVKMGAKVVWFPTTAAAAHQHHMEAMRAAGKQVVFPVSAIQLRPEPPLDIVVDGQLVPEVSEILEIVRDEGAILASGHLDHVQVDALFSKAAEMGVEKMVATHPLHISGITPDHAARLADLGVIMEHTLVLHTQVSYGEPEPIEPVIEWIRRIGPERTILTSDCGLKGNARPLETYRYVLPMLMEQGIGTADIRTMISDVPATLLDLD